MPALSSASTYTRHISREFGVSSHYAMNNLRDGTVVSFVGIAALAPHALTLYTAERSTDAAEHRARALAL